MVKHPINKSSFLDVRFTISNELDVDLEMQKDKMKSGGQNNLCLLVSRLTKYAVDMIYSNTLKGKNEFIGKKVHIVCLANFKYNVIKEGISDILLSDYKNSLEFDFVRLTIIFMPNDDKLDNKLKRWIELLKSDTPMVFKGDDEAMNEAVDVIVTCKNDEEIRIYNSMMRMQELDARVQAHFSEVEMRERIATDLTAELTEKLTSQLSGEEKKQMEEFVKTRVAELAKEEPIVMLSQEQINEKKELIISMYNKNISLEDISDITKISIEIIKLILGL